MNIVQETKACDACARSKRKCGKERPQCQRCSSRETECTYPPARPSSFVLLQDDPVSVDLPVTTASFGDSTSTFDFCDSGLLLHPVPDFDMAFCGADGDLQLRRPPSMLLPSFPPRNLSCDWFMSPETWKIMDDTPHHKGPSPPPPYCRVVLKRFLKQGQTWLSDWVSTGRNTFIHKQLYIFKYPRCVQDAYTTLALYLAKTEENEDVVFNTLEQRAKRLLQDEDMHKSSSSPHPFGHLSRVHALLTYQIIGLCDGDIRQRALAEERIPILTSWLKQMVDSVSVASALSSDSINGNCVAAILGLGLWLGIEDSPEGAAASSSTLTQEEATWHIYIFIESLRRTWILAQGIHAVFHALQKGWALCPGNMMFTAGQGVWDATSSYTWGQVCMETDIQFIDGEKIASLLSDAKPEAVDSFTRALMEITFGRERMERWESCGAL